MARMQFESLMDFYFAQQGRLSTLEYQRDALRREAAAITAIPDEYRSMGVAAYSPPSGSSGGVSDPVCNEACRHVDRQAHLRYLVSEKEAAIAGIEGRLFAIKTAISREDTENREILRYRYDLKYSLEMISTHVDLSPTAIRHRLYAMAMRIPRLVTAYEDGVLEPVADNQRGFSRRVAHIGGQSLVLSL